MIDDKSNYTLSSILNKILISRGAPKEKYSTNALNIKLSYPPLSLSQQDDISLIKQSIKSIEEYIIALTPDEFEKELKDNDSKYNELRIQHLKDISQSIKSGLIMHPLVLGFVMTYKILGNKEILRKLRRGFEKDVDRPFKHQDIIFINYIDRIEDYRKAGKTWKVIRRILMKRKIIGNISWQALQKKVAKFAPHISQNQGDD